MMRCAQVLEQLNNVSCGQRCVVGSGGKSVGEILPCPAPPVHQEACASAPGVDTSGLKNWLSTARSSRCMHACCARMRSAPAGELAPIVALAGRGRSVV